MGRVPLYYPTACARPLVGKESGQRKWAKKVGMNCGKAKLLGAHNRGQESWARIVGKNRGQESWVRIVGKNRG